MSKGLQLKSKEQIVEKFWSKVEKTDSCWNWQGARTSFGHGQYHSFKNHGLFDSRFAHRIAYWLTYGEYDSNIKVLHKCDNPSCVNPEHLFLGTQKDNVDDMYQKGRGSTNKAKGEKSGRAKLTWEQVREIRILYSKGDTSTRKLAEKYGVDNKVIHKIVRHETWKEI